MLKYFRRKFPRISIFLPILLFLAFFSSNSYSVGENSYIKARCVIHLHTIVSSGYITVEDYARLAKDSGVDAVIITDNALYKYEYGIWPLRGILKKVVEKDSILKYGAKRYLEEIEKTNNLYKDIVIIDGATVTPFYFWTGNVFKGGLKLNNRNKDIIVIGLGSAEAYERLPIVGTRYSKFDQYHGEKFAKPYQNLIDYANRQGALTFWSHPEFEENISISGVRLITIPYAYDLLSTEGYMGFGIFEDGYNTIGKPLGLWDRILTEYCQGKRKQPVWAIGELSFGGEENKNLDDTMNVLYLRTVSKEEVLGALKKGRFYVLHKNPANIHLALDEFSVVDGSGNGSSLMGEVVMGSVAPKIKIKLSHQKPIDGRIEAKLIRNNRIVKEFSGNGTAELEFEDKDVKPGEMVYYRVDAVGQGSGWLVTNPIFFKRIDK